MPVDKSTADSILDTYRNMLRDVDGRGLEGEAVDKMRAVLDRMEALAQELDDVIEFTTRLSTENLFVDFSNYYGKALMAASGQNSTGKEPTDEELLKQTLAAYDESLQTLEAEPAHAHIVPIVRKVVDIGRSGVSYPEFLRICEVEGVFLGLNSPHAKPVIEYEIYCAKLGHRPLEVKMRTEVLEMYERLVARSAFGWPDPLEYELARQKIEWAYEPEMIKWKMIEDRWDRMLSLVHDWVDSFCSFAPTDARWAGMGGANSRAVTMRNIKRTQQCNPGRLKVREQIFHDYFGLQWADIWTHPTYRNQYAARMIWYSDACLDYIKAAYDLCVPGGRPSDDLIAQAEKLYSSGAFKRADMISAEEMRPMEFAQWVQKYVSL